MPVITSIPRVIRELVKERSSFGINRVLLCISLATIAQSAGAQTENNNEAFTFATAIISVTSFVGGIFVKALIEWYKDFLGAKRSWATERRKIIDTLRLVFGHLDAFWEIVKMTQGDLSTPSSGLRAVYAEGLKSFDLSSVYNKLETLSSLAPGDSDKSAVAKYLVQQLLIQLLLLKRIQAGCVKAINSKGFDDVQELRQEAETQYNAIKIFVGSKYSEVFGLSGLRFIMESEIYGFKTSLLESRMYVADLMTKPHQNPVESESRSTNISSNDHQ